MTAWRIVLMALGCPITALADELPFAPVRVTVDYVATRVYTSVYSAGKDITETIQHGGDWTRVGAPNADPLGRGKTVYFDAANRLRVDLSTDNDLRRSVTITRNPKPNWQARPDRPSVKTNETDTVLGEPCEVWTVYRNDTATTLSCVARDGIELWRKMVTTWRGPISEMRLTHLERHTVPLEDVQPPAGILTLGQGMVPGASEGTLTMPDYEVVAREDPRGQQTEPVIITTRRRCPWVYEEVRAGDTRRDISINNRKSGIWLSYARHQAGGFERLSIHQQHGTGECEPDRDVRFKGLTKSEIVLGNLCKWYDLTPGMADAGRSACLTLDNIALKTSAWSRGGNNYDREVVSLRRGPVDTKDLSMPPELLSPAHWGLPR